MPLVKPKYDVVVVGAGPGGSIASRIAAEHGLSVLLLEKRQEIGTPVRCAEGTGTEVIRRYIDLEPAWIAQEINGGRIFSPNGTPVVLEYPGAGIVLERKIFDRRLAETAAEAGAEILVKARVTGVTKEECGMRNAECGMQTFLSKEKFDQKKQEESEIRNPNSEFRAGDGKGEVNPEKGGKVDGVHYRYGGKDYTVGAKIVIAADGIESQVGRWAGIDTTSDLRNVDVCAQYLMANIDLDEPEFCDFYVGYNIAPRGYAWIFPKGDRIANVGVGISGAASGINGKFAIDYLNEFVGQKFPKGSILSQIAGCVSTGDKLRDIVADGIMLVGDAAHHNDPISGGGIVNAMIGGHLAAEVAVEAIQHDDVSAVFLKEYERRWDREVGKVFKHLSRVREAVIKFSDETLDKCAQVLSKVPKGKLTVLQVFKTVLLNRPGLLLELRHLIAAGWL
ncbi:NAD(P)/FAD-dependent oxidoreductase [Candidatus Poribacteria bacterium]|nr:NAD(P)/FAD-dependent oxidoreductase [Candidatus Poribacteria bacterium]